jgi:hypothetical protein
MKLPRGDESFLHRRRPACFIVGATERMNFDFSTKVCVKYHKTNFDLTLFAAMSLLVYIEFIQIISISFQQQVSHRAVGLKNIIFLYEISFPDLANVLRIKTKNLCKI